MNTGTTSDSEREIEVNTAAAHILVLLDNVQEQLAKIRRSAEKLVRDQEASDASPT